MRFVDEVQVHVASGHGGAGHVSFLREAFRPRGGPDGGDGGKGGSVIFEATRQRNTLVDFRWNKVYKAEDGVRGGKQRMTGRGGEDLTLWVPVGTQLRDLETGELVADLDTEGDRFVIEGGLGGKGNAVFKSSTNRTPRYAQPGLPGTERSFLLELKLLADIGLLGFPNAGKSTLISRISAAKPKIASYPFTTLVPNLGVVKLSDGRSFVVADIPGLIEGASDGVGLGHQFLKHVERCAGYLHLVSLDHTEEASPVERFRALNEELRQYDTELVNRPQVVVLTKTDLLTDEEVEEVRSAFQAEIGTTVYAASSVSGDGLSDLVGAAWQLVRRARPELDQDPG